MIRCPEDERLSLLLDERLEPDELVAIERHLEACDRCQGALDGLTRDPSSIPDWRPWAAPVEGDEAGSRSSFDGLGADFGREQRRRAKLSGSFPSVRSPTLGPIGAGAAPGSGPEPGGLPTVEGYEILGRLGQGGMGVVYRARQRGLDRLVALKMIRAGSHAGPEHLLRFQIEVRAVARLRHPNVVQVYDVGEADGLPYVALELLEGGSLESRVAGTPQPEGRSAELIETLARAIASAHRAGVVHRDLKPANVLFNADGTPKIADFGLAKRLDQEDGQTHSGQVMGSPSFMAPEQARGLGRAVGPAADLYSLGAILYEMLAGRPPFKGGSAMETLFQVVNDEPVPPSKLRPGLSRDLETICLKCLAKEPDRRYGDADALADDLARHRGGAPILGRRTGPLERLGKWSRRQPAAAALVVASLGAVLVLAVALGRVERAARAHEGWVARRRAEGLVATAAARDALAQGRWKGGRKAIGPVLEAIGADPDLDDLRARARALLAELDRGEAADAGAALALARYREFDRLRREAQLRDAQSPAIGQPGGEAAATRAAAFEALAAFDEAAADGPASATGRGRSLGAWRPAPVPDSLPPEAKAEIARGRIELLLVWAEALAQGGPGEDPKAGAAEAVRVLELARDLGAPALAYRATLARCLLTKGDTEAAARHRAAADATPPADALDHLALGLERHRGRDWIAAIAEFEQALRLEPDQFRAQLLLAVCQLQVRRPAQARANLTACLQRAPKSSFLYRLRGFAYGEEGAEKQKIAREATPRLAALEAEGEGRFADAEADYLKALDLSRDDEGRYAVLVNRGVLRVRSRRLDDAVADLREAVRLRPDQFAAYVPLGQAYGKQGRADDAVEQFTRGIALRPDLPSLYRSRALARLDRPKPDPEARDLSLKDLGEAIRLEPAHSRDGAADRARRARLLHLAGRPEEALADSEAALAVAPDDAEALLFRVKSLLELKRFAEVVGAADAALARGIPTAELYDLRGQARASREDFAGAIGDYGQAIALDPGRSAPLVHRGWAYVVSNAALLALHDFDEAIRIDGESPEAHAGRGFARALQGQHRLAAADAEESLRRGGPPDARATYNAARIYAKAAAAVLEAPRRSLGSTRLADDYQERAQALIRLAIERLPEGRRLDFWRDVVQGDPALASIRQRPKFSQLAGQFGRQAR